MKFLLSIAVLTAFLTTTVKSSCASSLENRGNRFVSPISKGAFDDVPQSHWSYAAVSKLIRFSGLTNVNYMSASRPATRYEFAVATVQCSDALAQSGREVNQDVLTALQYEYGLEIIDLLARLAQLDSPSSQSEKEVKAIVLLARQERNVSTPDQWSEFLRQGLKFPRGPIPKHAEPFKVLTPDGDTIFLYDKVRLKYITPDKSK